MLKGIGERIKEARTSRGWSQQDLADKIGATKFLVCRYENESVLPSGKTLIKMAQALNVGIEYITGGTESPPMIDFYGDYFDKEGSRSKVLPLDIPDNSDYFSIQAAKHYPCGIDEGDTLVLRPLICPTSGEVVMVEYLSAELLFGLLRADNGSLWLLESMASQPIDISDSKKYKVVAELMYSIKKFGRRK